jgi:hypothetical protein
MDLIGLMQYYLHIALRLIITLNMLYSYLYTNDKIFRLIIQLNIQMQIINYIIESILSYNY